MADTDVAPARPNQFAEEVYADPSSDSTVAVKMAEAELNQHIATAHRYPRSLSRVKNRIYDLATLDPATAEECVYTLPRAGKTIQGPTVRFAEIVVSQYGNCHVGSRVIAVDLVDKVIVAEGAFWDLESGMKRIAQVRRRITDRSGRLLNEDMIVVTGNAAASIAMREAVLKGVPKALWREAYEAAEKVKVGDIRTLGERRGAALKGLSTFGVRPEDVFLFLGVAGVDEIDLDHVAAMRDAFRDIKDGTRDPDAVFPTLSLNVADVRLRLRSGKPADAAPPAPAPKPRTPRGTAPKASDGQPPAAEPAAEPEGDAGDAGDVVEDGDTGDTPAEPATPEAPATPAAPEAPAAPELALAAAPATPPKRLRELRNLVNTILADAAQEGADAVRDTYAGTFRALETEAPDLLDELEGELARYGTPTEGGEE